MIKATIFDLDGVLVDTPKYGFDSDKKALDFFKVKLEKNDYCGVEGKSLKLRIPYYENKFNVKIDFKKFSELFIKTQMDLVKLDILENKGKIISLFERIFEKNIKIGIATSASSKKVNQILNLLGVETYLDSLVCLEDVRNSKPDPEPYLRSLEKLNVKKEEAIIVEDSPIGIRAAISSGVKTVALKTDNFDLDELSHSDEIIFNLDEVLDLL